MHRARERAACGHRRPERPDQGSKKDFDGQQLFVKVRNESGVKLLRLSISLQVTAMG
jgi:hypothetical protein